MITKVKFAEYLNQPTPSAVNEYKRGLRDSSAQAPLDENKETLWVSGGRISFVEEGKDTDGRYSLFDIYIPPKSGTKLHNHTRENEWFYILDGTTTFQLDNETTVAASGTLVYGPSVINHAFRNLTTEPLRMLLYYEPSGIEGFFREFGQPVTDPFNQPLYDTKELVSSGHKYGLDFLSSLEFEKPEYLTYSESSIATVSVVRAGNADQAAGSTIALSNGIEIPLNFEVGESYKSVDIFLPEDHDTIDLTLKDAANGSYIGLLGNKAVVSKPVPKPSSLS